MLMQDARCYLFKPLLLSFDAASQSIIFMPFGITVLNLCIQVDSLLTLKDPDLGMSSDIFMYSSKDFGLNTDVLYTPVS